MVLIFSTYWKYDSSNSLYEGIDKDLEMKIQNHTPISTEELSYAMRSIPFGFNNTVYVSFIFIAWGGRHTLIQKLWVPGNSLHMYIWLNEYFFPSHTHLIKASNDLIKQSEAVHSFMFDLFLLKVLIEPSNWGKHNTHFIIGLRVKLLKRKL